MISKFKKNFGLQGFHKKVRASPCSPWLIYKVNLVDHQPVCTLVLARNKSRYHGHVVPGVSCYYFIQTWSQSSSLGQQQLRNNVMK